MLGKLDRTNVLVAGGVWLATLVVYWMTTAATVSFWDCGEFIACGYILGIPHPPGTPLYILVARLFSLLPLAADAAVRINLLSSISSSFTALFGYLIAVRILRAWIGTSKSWYGRLLTYGGGACGAFFLAFSLTNWNNSVEAEVYGLSMALIAAIMWLGLKYVDCEEPAGSARLLLAAVFLAFLGIAVHMTTFLVFPAVALFFVVRKGAPAAVWYALAVFFALELYYVFAFSSLPGEIPYYLPVTIVSLVFLFYVFSFDTVPSMYLWTAGGFGLSIVPLLSLGVQTISRRAGSELAVTSVVNNIGLGAFGVLTLFGLWALLQYFSKRAGGLRRHYLVCALFVIVADVMVVLLQLPKGYATFLVISVLTVAGLVALMFRWVRWPILVALVGSSTVMLGINEFVIGLGLAIVAVPLLGLTLKIPGWRTGLLIVLMAIMGFSVHAFIPIRSAQSPAIDENNPSESLRATVNYLERKQYGSVSMISRMFIRRADWSHQFGVYPRMGFWGFFDEQYGLTGPAFVILVLLGIFGIWEIMRRRPDLGAPLLVLLLISTVGLVLYMNFADGTRNVPGLASDHLEVRDRDYFFTPGFIFFGLAIGVGITILIQYLRDGVRSLSGGASTAAKVAGLILLLGPSFALAHNYNRCDRSQNYMAYDYAWNLLQSADPNAILFTNGDNDTFPLWCLQEVYGVRPDVAVVCLALANTQWYIKQMQTTMGVDLGWTEAHIDSLRPFRLPDEATLNSRNQRISPRIYDYLARPEAERDSLWALGVPYGASFQFRDMVVDKIIYSLFGKRPINYSVTTGRGSRRYLGRQIDNRLSLRGMHWSVRGDTSGMLTELEPAVAFFTEPGEFQARGVNDPGIYKDETARRLTANWANGFLMVADTLKAAGDLDGAAALAARASRLIPHSGDAIEFYAAVKADQGDVNAVESLLAVAQYTDTLELQTQLASAYRKAGDNSSAERLLGEILQTDPRHRGGFESLLQIYYETKQFSKMIQLMEQWLAVNPQDERVRAMLQQLRTDSIR
ncbi:MAG: DUF2723 domain-containing protein [bacterium]